MLKLFCFSLLWCILSLTRAQEDELSVEMIMDETAIVPDLLTEAPEQLLKIIYGKDLNVGGGKVFTPTQLKLEPKIEWEAEQDAYYTVIMLTPDSPRRANPVYRCWVHWMVVNVPGMDVDSGETLAEYYAPISPHEFGLLRYVILVYEQPKKLQFDEPKMDLYTAADHSNFDLMEFVEKYELNNPVAGNVFQAEWDLTVAELLETLYSMVAQ